MQIWVDADACPRAVKEILFKTAVRRSLTVTLVANQPMHVPPSPFIRMVVVSAGFDVADNEIARRVEPGDLVITADIPLAAAIVAKGAHGLSPRGERFTEENVGERLAIRDFMADLRDAGEETGGPSAFGPRQRKAFADQLDRLLATVGR
jgi:uncharacterized protein YaiI (UPF0178 family)